MRSQPDSLQPPRIAVWLLSLFDLAETTESILGNLLEEFLLIASDSGAASARSWYWRQTLRTAPRLAVDGFRTAPWTIAAAVVGGFLLRKLVGPLVEPAIFAVIGKYQVYEHHFSTYMFLASTGIDIGHLITFLIIGLIVAFAARESELAVTMVLGFIYAAMAVVGSVYVATRTGDNATLWRLTWYFADAFAVVIAGAIVRTHRLGAISQPKNAQLGDD